MRLCRLIPLLIAFRGRRGDLVHVRDATLVLNDADVTFAAFATAPDRAKPFGYGSGLVLTGAAHAMVAEEVFGGHDQPATER